MHSWSHVRTHESTHTHTHTRSKRSLWKASVFFPTHSHTPTHHHVSVLGILFSPPSPEYDMALGLHLSCIHTISLTVQDIWQTKSSGVSNVWQMKITKGPHGDLLCGTCLKKLFCFPFDIFFCQCENISFQNYFSLLLFKSLDCQWKANSLRIPNWAKEKKKKSLTLHCFKDILVHIWHSQLGILVCCAPWCGEPFLGVCFPQISPSVTALLESADLKAIILYLGYERLEKSRK